MNKSHVELPLLDFAVDELVEAVCGDGLCAVAPHGVDDVLELLVGVAVLELVVDVPHVVEVEFALALGVQQGEVVSASLFREGGAL